MRPGHSPSWVAGIAIAIVMAAVPVVCVGQATPGTGESSPTATATATSTATPAPSAPAITTSTPLPEQPTVAPSPAPVAEPQFVAIASVEIVAVPNVPSPSPASQEESSDDSRQSAEEVIAPTVATPVSTVAAANQAGEPRAPTAPPHTLSIRVESGDVHFGPIDVAGRADSDAPPDLSIDVDQYGAIYALPAAIALAVESASPWLVTCSATGLNAQSEALIERGHLLWRKSGSDDWTPLSSSAAKGACLSGTAESSTTLLLDLGLRITPATVPGQFAATVHFVIGPG